MRSTFKNGRRLAYKTFLFSFLLGTFVVPSVAFSQADFSDLKKYFDLLPGASPETYSALESAVEQAQDSFVERSVALTTEPTYPGPREDVLVKISVAGTDIMRSDIAWYLNGKLTDRGIGETTFSFRTGNPGTVSSVSVIIRTVEGLRIDKTLSINPAGMDIVWEADSYVPPFYKGKALPTPQSTVRVIALPEFVSSGGSRVDPGTLIYVWKNEDADTGLVNDSGYGKRVLSTSMPQLSRSKNISVEVSSLGNSIKTKRSASVPSGNVRLMFYENNPILGVRYEQAIGNAFNLENDEFSVKAEPFYFSIKDRGVGNLSYQWTLGGDPITPDSNEIVTFKQEVAGIGSETVSLAIRNIGNIFQQSKASFVLNFKK